MQLDHMRPSAPVSLVPSPTPKETSQTGFKQKMLQLVETSFPKIAITQEVLDDPLWSMLQFDENDAKKIYANIQLYKKIAPGTFFMDDKVPKSIKNLESKSEDFLIDTSWPLFLLAGKEFPDTASLSPGSQEYKRYQMLELHCFAHRDKWGRSAIDFAVIGQNKKAFEYLIANWKAKTLLKEEYDLSNTDLLYSSTLEYIRFYTNWLDSTSKPMALKNFSKYSEKDLPDNLGRKTIHHTVISGDLKAVKEVIAVLPDSILPIKATGRLPLHYAVYYDHEHIVTYFFDEQKVNPGVIDTHQRNLFFYAACSTVPMWNFLLDKLKNHASKLLKQIDDQGNNVLMFAIANKNWPLLEKLLESKLFDPNHKNKKGETALDLIAGIQEVDNVCYAKLLVKAGSILPASALYSAISNGTAQMVKYLFENSSPSYLDQVSAGIRPLDRAITTQTDSGSKVTILLALGADPKLVTTTLESKAIIAAVYERSAEEIKVCLAYFTILKIVAVNGLIANYLLANWLITIDLGVSGLEWRKLSQQHEQDQKKLLQGSLRTVILSPLLKLIDESKASHISISLAKDFYGSLVKVDTLALGEKLRLEADKEENGWLKKGNHYRAVVKTCLEIFDTLFPKSLQIITQTQRPSLLDEPKSETSASPVTTTLPVSTSTQPAPSKPATPIAPQITLFSQPTPSSLPTVSDLKIDVDRTKLIAFRNALKINDVYTCFNIIGAEKSNTALIEYYKAAFKQFHARCAIDPTTQAQATVNTRMIFSSILTTLQEKNLLKNAKELLATDIILNGLSGLELDDPDELIEFRHKQVLSFASAQTQFSYSSTAR